MNPKGCKERGVASHLNSQVLIKEARLYRVARQKSMCTVRFLNTCWDLNCQTFVSRLSFETYLFSAKWYSCCYFIVLVWPNCNHLCQLVISVITPVLI